MPKTINTRESYNKKNLHQCLKCGLKRFYQFTRIGNTSASNMMSKSKRIPDQKCPYRHIGLTSKEKSYLIRRCQSKSARYITLKNLAQNAVKEKKIFTIYGVCKVLRKELTGRGWVEKYPYSKMTLSKLQRGPVKNQTQVQEELEKILLSNFVSKYPPNLIWRMGDDSSFRKIERAPDGTTIENKLTIDTMWTTKHGLCSSMKRNYWFYVEDVSEVTAPRTYNTFDICELEDFYKDYKITACTSLLKWVLFMVAHQKPVFTVTGKISTNILVFALNRCKEYLCRKQNKDIDQKFNVVSEEQWNTFLNKYYLLIDKKEVFERDVEKHKLRVYLGYTKFLLKEICRYRPQLNCEGYHNIWIIKPPHNSRGRGIRMASKLAEITSIVQKSKKAKYVFQKYIEEPLLIHETKFDIRQYYIVTSTYPLIIWMYEDCYLKFSSQKYNIMDYHESIHLTNNAVQRKYKNCVDRHPELPVNNMWDLKTYKAYLKDNGQDKTWESVIYPGMRKAIISIMLSCQDAIPVSKNRFELYGCDFILDKTYKPWLIEINSGPDLSHTTSVTATICPAVIADIVKVVIDYHKNENASTGNFECIYHQPMTTPKYGTAADLSVRGYSLPSSYFYKGDIPDIPLQNNYYNNVDTQILNNSLEVSQAIEGYYDATITKADIGSAHNLDETGKQTESIVTEKKVSTQLQDLKEMITSGKSNYLSRNLSMKSMTKIETALKKSMSRLASAVVVGCTKGDESQNVLRIKEAHPKLKLSHNPPFNTIQRILKTFESKQQEQSKKPSKVKIRRSSHHESEKLDSQNIIKEASTDIVNFIKNKEIEYNIDCVNITINKTVAKT